MDAAFSVSELFTISGETAFSAWNHLLVVFRPEDDLAQAYCPEAQRPRRMADALMS
jgi:hypothetical protein